MTLKKITAPWTQEQVDMLNAAQNAGHLHPFTCPGDGPGCGSMHETRDLIATVDGWVCACGRYRQDWAFDFPPEILAPLAALQTFGTPKAVEKGDDVATEVAKILHDMMVVLVSAAQAMRNAADGTAPITPAMATDISDAVDALADRWFEAVNK